MTDREALIIGALLHDIGKFKQRSQQSTGQDHSEIGAQWLESMERHGLDPRIKHFARYHHHRQMPEIRLSNWTLIVYESDNLSSAERAMREGRFDARHTPLMSVFSRVALDSTERDYKYHRLEALGDRIVYPADLNESNVNVESYSELWAKFENDFIRMLQGGISINRVMLLMEKYTSYVPSETRADSDDPSSYPDISLFDHCKTSAAIAAAMLNYLIETKESEFERSILESDIRNKNDFKYLLVGGDLSGVQDFIYTISSKGALKTLRARSFFLELFTEHVISETLDLLQLSRVNLIYSGGGRFYLLAQNTPKSVELTDKAQDKTNEWLYSKFGSKLYLAMASCPFNGGDFQPSLISGIWSNLSSELARSKGKKFHKHLSKIIEPQEPALPREVCSICHRDDMREELRPIRSDDPETAVCSICHMLYDLGDRLPDAKFIGKKITDENDSSVDILMFDMTDTPVGYRLINSAHDLANDDYNLVYVINSWNLADYLLSHNSVQLLLGNYTRTVGDLPDQARPSGRIFRDNTASFEDLAEAAVGAERIACLRMDVDNLGQIFARGVPTEYRSFSRLTSISRQLSLFFKYYLNYICSGGLGERIEPLALLDNYPTQGRNVSVVYSGGDDVFIVGSWSDVAELCFDIYRCFRKFVGHNKGITISGGFVVQEHQFPLYQMADLAYEAEELAKDNGRNSVTLFYNPALKPVIESKGGGFKQSYKWDEAEKSVMELINMFVKLGDIDEQEHRFRLKVSHSLIYKLLSLFTQWQIEGVLYLPRMAYTLRRIRDAIIKSSDDELISSWMRLETRLLKPDSISELRTALLWVELLSRSKEGGKNESEG